MSEFPYDIGTGPKKFSRVRVKATDEIGRLAYKSSAGFFMNTATSTNTASTYVEFEETGEFRIYAKSALELLDD